MSDDANPPVSGEQPELKGVDLARRALEDARAAVVSDWWRPCASGASTTGVVGSRPRRSGSPSFRGARQFHRLEAWLVGKSVRGCCAG